MFVSRRLRIGSVVLGLVLVVSTCGYRLLGYEWLDALYMVVITVASVGYAEHSSTSPQEKVFTIFVILFGIGAAGYTLGGLAQMFFEGEIERALGMQRMTTEIKKLDKHTIICGFGRIGQILAADLRRHHRAFIILENDMSRFQDAQHRQYLALHGDATDEELLIQAGVARAASLISALPNDAANVFITLTARNLNRDLQIIARAELPSTEKKLRQAGANRIVMPASIGAQQMVRMITRPSTADLMDLIARQGNMDLELDEIEVPLTSKLVGVSVRDSEAHREHHLLVLAVKQASGQMIFHPDADYQFQVGDVAIVLGDSVNILRFRTQYGV